MKTALKITLLISVIGYLVFTVATLSKKNEDYVCCGVDVVVRDTSEKTLLNKEFVTDILANKKISPQGQTISKININRIEQIIGENAYIDSVQCYFTPKHNLCIRVIPRKPIMHVITDDTEYYMDASGNTMPTSKFNLDLCLMTGNISEKLAKEKLLPLASFLDNNEPWKNEVQQVNVIDEQHIELIPLTGEHRIRIGNGDNIKEKMEKLLLFRKEGLDKIGWNKYTYIDLSYNGQIVCTKKN